MDTDLEEYPEYFTEAAAIGSRRDLDTRFVYRATQRVFRGWNRPTRHQLLSLVGEMTVRCFLRDIARSVMSTGQM